MTATDTDTSAFGRQLRLWRTQRGLTQLDLATRAETTPRHLSFLETGRSRPRTEMVLRLAGVLDLRPRERNRLLEAAGLRPAFAPRSLADPEMSPYRDAIDSLLQSHEPLPAAVVDRYGAIRQANAAFERIAPGLIGLEPEELVDRTFGARPWRDSIINWSEVASAWIAGQRREAQRTGDSRLAALVERAQALIGPAPHLADNPDAPIVCSRMRVGDEVLELFTAVVRFDDATDINLSELRIELIYPANETARSFFRRAG
jgi:transcriptional regulator with XRE-family HTH domain